MGLDLLSFFMSHAPSHLPFSYFIKKITDWNLILRCFKAWVRNYWLINLKFKIFGFYHFFLLPNCGIWYSDPEIRCVYRFWPSHRVFSFPFSFASTQSCLSIAGHSPLSCSSLWILHIYFFADCRVLQRWLVQMNCFFSAFLSGHSWELRVSIRAPSSLRKHHSWRDSYFRS